MANRPNLTVNADRLWDSLMEMAKIGGTPKGGCNRQSLTAEDREGRALFRRWCEAAGAKVGVDPMGSMFARIEGQADLPPLLIGSHLDTQPTGGKFDGVLGVLAGLEILRVFQESGIRPNRPIEIVNWTNEEGSRFAPAMMASGVFAGILKQEAMLECRDREGVRFGDALAAFAEPATLPLGGRAVGAYLELHIEQGPVLESEGFDIGVVTGGQGLRWMDVTVTGFESHAGTTPMPRRKDALAAASRLMLDILGVADAFSPDAVATLGQVKVLPGSRNVIPGEVTFSVDIRHPDGDIMRAMEARVHEAVAAANRDSVTARVSPVDATEPTLFDAHILATMREEATRLGLKHRDIISGAGHDAIYMAKLAPSAMIFTPCRDGISHNESEDILPEWARDGANLLLRMALRLSEAREISEA